MSIRARQLGDRGFTVLALLPVFLIAIALLGILAPMIWRGAGAVFFRGTVEFRRMRLERYDRGSGTQLEHELASAAEARKPAYQIVDRFRRGIDTSGLEKEARLVFSRFTDELDYRDTPADTRRELRRRARRLRNDLIQAFETTDSAEALQFLDSVLASRSDPDLADTAAEGFFDLARRYRAIVGEVDLTRRHEYAEALDEVQQALTRLLGPRPEEPRPPLAQNQYGATRWDQAVRYLDDILFAETWELREPGRPMEKVRTPRSQQFAGTSLEPLFPLIEENLDEMLLPRFTAYWGYFTDDSTPGHFFGGAGPEILGTVVLTLLAILLAFPLGVISAAYLVEVAGDNWIVNLIRMCINTLAGVPSIVFGLFGLAFVVLWLFPRIGLRGEPCTLAAAITLAVLILPVIIRASEEAIRAVPPTYKEASLALGASRFRCFVTVQLPAALPGILTGVILSMSRAAGETAPILFTGAVALGPVLEVGGWPPLGWLFRPTRALSYGSYDIAVGDRLAALVPHQQFGMVMTLVGLVLLLNLTAIVIRSRISKRLRGQ